MSDYKEGTVCIQERDRLLDELWAEREMKSARSKIQTKFEAFGLLLDDTVDHLLLGTKQAVFDLLGAASGEDEVITMLRDPPAFESAAHMQWLLDAVVESGAVQVPITAAVSRRNEEEYLYGEQIDLSTSELDGLDATTLLDALAQGREVDLDQPRFWKVTFRTSMTHRPGVVQQSHSPQKDVLQWLRQHPLTQPSSPTNDQYNALIRKLLLSEETDALTQAANVQLYRRLLATGLCDIGGAVSQAWKEAMEALTDHSSSSEPNVSVERELIRTKSQVLRLRREVMGDESAAELLEDNDAVVGHQAHAIDRVLKPVEQALTSFALPPLQHDILVATAAFDCVYYDPHQLGAPGLLRVCAERLHQVGQASLQTESGLQPLESVTLEALDEHAGPWLDSQITEGFFAMGVGDDETQQMLQSLMDMQIHLRAAVERLDSSSRRVRKRIARQAIQRAANHLFASATASLVRPFGPTQLLHCCTAILRIVRADEWKMVDGRPNPHSARERLSFALPVRLYSAPQRPFFRELARLVCLEALRAVPTEEAVGVFYQTVPDSEAAGWFTRPLASAVATCQQTIITLLTDLRSEDEKLNLVRVLDESHLTDHAAQRAVAAGGTQKSAQGEGDRFLPAPSVVWALQAWIAQLTPSEDALIRRLIEVETWVPSELSGVHSSSKARDLLQLLYSHISAFFSLQVPAPVAFSRVVEKLWAGIGSYLRIVHSFCEMKTVVPQCPPLRRPAITPSEQDILNELPQLFPVEATAALSATTLESVILMLNDCYYVHEQCHHLNERITSAWVELCATDPAYQSVSDEGVRISNYQCRTVQVAIELVYLPTILEYIGARVAYYELREPLLCRLFAPTVARTPLSTVTQVLAAEVLPLIERTINPACGERAFQAVARWCLKVLLHVLLDGGRARSFHISDASKLDLQFSELLMFFSNQMDVQQSALDKDIKPVVRVIHWMGMEFHALEHEFQSMPAVVEKSDDVIMPDCQYRVVQVLARRASDPRAMRFVKKRIKDFDQVLDLGGRTTMPIKHLKDELAAVLGDVRRTTPYNGGAMVSRTSPG